jgi:hypothetical protein
MSITNKNKQLVDEIFKPNENGESEWLTRDFIDTTELKLGNNGNIRRGTPWSDKYVWEIKRSNERSNSRPIAFRTIGLSEAKALKMPIRDDIKQTLISMCPRCLHCGTDKNLVIDHKNDMYNDSRVLCKETQTIYDFQVLCDKCNNDYKHNAHVKERETGKLHSVKYLNLPVLKYDGCEYPWEKICTTYDETNMYCKLDTYWYDIEEWHRKRHIYITYIRPLHREIKRKIKMVD